MFHVGEYLLDTHPKCQIVVCLARCLRIGWGTHANSARTAQRGARIDPQG